MSTGNLFNGVVHGRIIELDSDPHLPEGEKVTLEIRTSPEAKIEALKRAAGAWKDMPGVDEWLAETYAARLSDPR
ncbi:MAG: hypothetical protein WD875_14495 [Pirellulales bacterium]